MELSRSRPGSMPAGCPARCRSSRRRRPSSRSRPAPSSRCSPPIPAPRGFVAWCRSTGQRARGADHRGSGLPLRHPPEVRSAMTLTHCQVRSDHRGDPRRRGHSRAVRRGVQGSPRPRSKPRDLVIICYSGDLEKTWASLILATTAAASGVQHQDVPDLLGPPDVRQGRGGSPARTGCRRCCRSCSDRASATGSSPR